MTKFNKFQLVLVTFLIGVSTFFGGYYFGKRGYLFELRKNPPKINIVNQFPPDQNVDFALFWTVWNSINEKHLERPFDAQALMYGAIEGMVASLGDPYTSYLPPELNESVNNSINGNYEGIGAELAIRDGNLIVVAPLDGSPAVAAGVRAGDHIVEIDGTSTTGVSLTEAVFKIRGEAGTIVNLTVSRDAGTPFVITIKRGVINVESVTWENKEDGTVYIRVSRFGGDTTKNWSRVVGEINSQVEVLDALVIDLRGNPGGYMEAAAFIADEFFNDKAIFYIESPTGEQEERVAERIGAFESLPGVFVLIDEGSASASEILAAALRSNADAVLVGSKSFGKGTIQDVEDFADGSGVHITIAKWLTPEKDWVHDNGIVPEVEVARTPEDINAGKDLQLEKAIELANQL